MMKGKARSARGLLATVALIHLVSISLGVVILWELNPLSSTSGTRNDPWRGEAINLLTIFCLGHLSAGLLAAILCWRSKIMELYYLIIAEAILLLAMFMRFQIDYALVVLVTGSISIAALVREKKAESAANRLGHGQL